MTTNYKFNKQYAHNIKPVVLFEMLFGLIEIQRKATLFRANIKKHDLDQFGICANLDKIVTVGDHRSWYLRNLFFKGFTYPITPYSSEYRPCDPNQINYRWGKGNVGDQRIQILELMIKDLTNFLIKDAK